MADNTTTKEDNTKKIERKEKTQQLAHKLAGDIFCCQLWILSGKKCQTNKTENRTFENGAESSSFRQKAKVLENHPVKVNKPNGHIKAAP